MISYNRETGRRTYSYLPSENSGVGHDPLFFVVFTIALMRVFGVRRGLTFTPGHAGR